MLLGARRASGRFIAPVAELMLPPPADFQPPVLWGTEAHVSELLEPLGVTLRCGVRS